HDGQPTACVGDAAFAYVNAFTAHVNVGFFRGAELADPKGLLEGAGKFMRHVKLRPQRDVDATTLMKLIETAYSDLKARRKVDELVRGWGEAHGRENHPRQSGCFSGSLTKAMPNRSTSWGVIPVSSATRVTRAAGSRASSRRWRCSAPAQSPTTGTTGM